MKYFTLLVAPLIAASVTVACTDDADGTFTEESASTSAATRGEPCGGPVGLCGPEEVCIYMTEDFERLEPFGICVPDGLAPLFDEVAHNRCADRCANDCINGFTFDQLSHGADPLPCIEACVATCP
jgi:hypothetical protein